MTQSIYDSKRKTVGALAHQVMADKDNHGTIGELKYQNYDGHWDGLLTAVETNKKRFDGSFFIEIVKKNDVPEGPHAFHYRFNGRRACPKPNYNQDVFYYNRKDDALTFVWTMPDKNTCLWLLHDPEFFGEEVKREVMPYIHAFYSGDMYKHMKRINNEHYKGDTGIILYRPEDTHEFTKTNALKARGKHERK